MTTTERPPQLDVLPDPSGLLAAIIANPLEDTPRLEYADWLDELGTVRVPCPACKSAGYHVRTVATGLVKMSRGGVPVGITGDGKIMERVPCEKCAGAGTVLDTARRDRAELIRVQCELARLPKYEEDFDNCRWCDGSGDVGDYHASRRCRVCDGTGKQEYKQYNRVKELVRRNSLLYEPCLAPMVCGGAFMTLDFHFDRGFLSRVECPWDWFAKGGDALRAVEWCPLVKLSDGPWLIYVGGGEWRIDGDPTGTAFGEWQLAGVPDTRDWVKAALELRYPGTTFELPGE